MAAAQRAANFQKKERKKKAGVIGRYIYIYINDDYLN